MTRTDHEPPHLLRLREEEDNEEDEEKEEEREKDSAGGKSRDFTDQQPTRPLKSVLTCREHGRLQPTSYYMQSDLKHHAMP